MADVEYYDGTKLLSMKDLDGNTPEIIICTTNRTGGKTTYFNRLVMNKFMKTGSKFALLYRLGYELDGVADAFFKDIHNLFFREYYMTSKKMMNGMYHELYISTDAEGTDAKHCGYAIALNNADAMKKKSALFSDIDRILFDEFQSENNKYCTDELTKFKSIHTTIARGQGEQVRFVPVYMLSNQVSIINPYYVELGISERLQQDTNFLKGHGFILENGFIETASRAQTDSAFNRAFNQRGDDKYLAYSSQNIYLNDSMSFIETPKGQSRYIATLRYKGRDYAIREYREQGYLYCDERADITFKNKISVTTDDHNINYIMLKSSDTFISTLRWYFDHGCFRFRNLQSKECVMKTLSY